VWLLASTGRSEHHSEKEGWMHYLVVVEQGKDGYRAYVPDLPGCIAAAETRDEVLELIHEAIELHVEGLRERGESVPAPTSSAEQAPVGVC
jgi:predicted RNase H-like HicB family nuclease